LTTAEVCPAGNAALTFAGQLTTGGSASTTVTKKKQRFAFSKASRATQVTSVAPTGNVDPDGGTQSKLAAVQLSVAVGTG